MKPAPFEYARPSTLDEAIRLLVEGGTDAKPLSGGQSLVPLMAFRLVRPALLVDLGGIDGLNEIAIVRDRVCIGGATTHRAVETDEMIGRLIPLVPTVMSDLGHVAIRNVGTVGGSLAHADPAAEWPALALALDGVVVATGPNGSREIPIGDFFTDWMTTDLAVGEIITSLEVSVPPPQAGWGFSEVARRHGDFALAGAIALLQVDGGVIGSARVALLGLDFTPVRARTVEAQLRGAPVNSDTIGIACASVEADIEPLDDAHASASYKLHLASVVTSRAVRAAIQRTESQE